ncbi:MAG: glycerol-3-phosphate dehydrogenase/oxidase [Anaerolineaceae bacterium]
MWEKGWREAIWQDIEQDWDILVIGGGITGAGVFRRAVSAGLKTLLLDAGDFASGTSSRSSKLVHGGFRYLKNKQWSVTHESVREREWLLREAKDLVTPLGFLMPNFSGANTNTAFAVGVVIYDLMAPKWKHSFFPREKMLHSCPQLRADGLEGGYLYYDAEMDDAHLVHHILREAVMAGGTALNYARADKLLRSADGRVCGVIASDTSGQASKTAEIKAKVVINAAGPWSDDLRTQVGAAPRIRPLRGSHLIFDRERLPIPHAVTLLHPRDHRAMFGIPWEGVTMIGTTDLDHKPKTGAHEPFAESAEIDYILEAGNATFGTANLTRADIVSSFAGLRPIISTGQADPSKESRAHVVWEEHGLITVTGGKLTTFRIMAEEALEMAAASLPGHPDFKTRVRYFNPLPKANVPTGVTLKDWTYLLGRYSSETDAMLRAAQPGELEHIESLPNIWAEIRWAARCGGVLHLDDLLLRRVRIGMLLADGANSHLERVRKIAQSELGWNDLRWKSEVERYQKIYRAYYSPEPTGQEK